MHDYLLKRNSALFLKKLVFISIPLVRNHGKTLLHCVRMATDILCKPNVVLTVGAFSDVPCMLFIVVSIS